MTSSIIFAIGVYWIVVGLRAVIAPAATRALIDVLEDNPALTFVGGVILLLVGTAILLKHNLWGTPREIFASLVIWIATIEGALMVIAPGALFAIGRKFMPSDPVFRILGVVLIILGIAVIAVWT